ncbi:MAG: hypothetical protein N3E51_03610 [Candidatus Micrarchaeota archaeon]|nr:hypothetical protein [Candidatus Micrarchaeota archaeon]
MRGQSSTEFMLVVALGLVFIASLYFFTSSFSNENVRLSQARDTADKLASSADYAGSLGEGASIKVAINIPEGISLINVSGNRVQLRLSTQSGQSDVFSNTRYSILGSVPTSAGMHEITITRLSNNRVLFGRSYLSCSPRQISLAVAQGNSSQSAAIITNTANFTLTSLSVSISGEAAAMLSATQPPSSLAPQASAVSNITASVPPSKQPGAYQAVLSATASNNSECSSVITIFVTRAGGEDIYGPATTSISYFPSFPNTTTAITVNATGNDTLYGNSTIISCQLELDYSGIWMEMAAADGSFDSPVERATLLIGTLPAGNRTVRVRCIDWIGNVGAPSSITISVLPPTSPDSQGPVVQSLSLSPPAPNTSSIISVSAIANDTATGGSNIKMCEASVDGGSWLNMSATDGNYSSPVEQVTRTIGSLPRGTHNVSVRCSDVIGNNGTASTLWFNVTSGYKKNILIITASSTPTAAESYWINWIANRTSNESFSWAYDLATQAAITSNATNLSDYRIAALPSSPASNPALWAALNAYRSTGNFVVLLGQGMQYGVPGMGVGSSISTQSTNSLVPRVSHYITSGFTVGTTYTIQTASSTIYYSTNITTNVLSTTTSTRAVVAAGATFVTHGSTRPDTFNANGDTFARRVIDWALLNSPN